MSGGLGGSVYRLRAELSQLHRSLNFVRRFKFRKFNARNNVILPVKFLPMEY